MVRYTFATMDKAALFVAYLAIHSSHFEYSLQGYDVTISGGVVTPYTEEAFKRIVNMTNSEVQSATPSIPELL